MVQRSNGSPVESAPLTWETRDALVLVNGPVKRLVKGRTKGGGSHSFTVGRLSRCISPRERSGKASGVEGEFESYGKHSSAVVKGTNGSPGRELYHGRLLRCICPCEQTGKVTSEEGKLQVCGKHSFTM